MSNLNAIFRSFSKSDLLFLEENINQKSKRSALLELLVSFPDASDSFLAEKLGYDPNSSSFSTLKHRFIDEIADIFFENDPNPYIKINQRVAVLRSSIYSAHEFLFEHELNRCYKTAKRLEAFEALYQILKLKLVFAKRRFHSSTEIAKLEEELSNIQEVKQIVNQVENSFYSILFAYNLNVFHIEKTSVDSIVNNLSPIETKFGHFKTVKFLIQSLKLDITIKSKTKVNEETAREIDELIRVFEHSTLNYKYPMGLIGLKVMKNKFQFLANLKSDFEASFKEIWKSIPTIADKNMYLGVNIYLLFLVHYQYKQDQITEKELARVLQVFKSSKHPLILTAIHFYNACLLFNHKLYNEAYAELNKSRQNINLNIRTHSLFPLEICTLATLCQLNQKEVLETSLSYEINALKYCNTKMNLTKKHPVYELLHFARKTLKEGMRGIIIRLN